MKFQKYWKNEELSDALKKKQIIVGPIRINNKNYNEAFVAHPDGYSDVFVCGMEARNRALTGDIVYVEIFPKEKWKILVDDLVEKEDDIINAFKKLDLTIVDDSIKDLCASSSINVENVNTIVDHSPNNKTKTNKNKSNKINSKQNKPVNKNAQNCKESTNKSTPNKFVAITDLLSMTNDKVAKSPTCKKIHKMLFNGETTSNEELTNEKLSQVASMLPQNIVVRTAQVVGIAEMKNSRLAAGILKPMSDGKLQSALFSPLDNRFPRIFIPGLQCPEGFFHRPNDFSKTLFVAKIVAWEDYSTFPLGELVKNLGMAGEVGPETEGILLEHGVDDEPFSQEVISCLPLSNDKWCVGDLERQKRRDFTKHCLFTIDPLTARDLDDAVSCELLPNGNYEVGVHIADVSHFVLPGTELDAVAANRATSVYLVQKVVPMLPHLLCEKLCSLNPDEDRLAFSVVWQMTPEGQIVEEWFGKSVIRSCVKLAYEHAQGFIDHKERKWTAEELPPISSNFSIEDIQKRVLSLHSLAVLLRKARFDGGALRLDQVKLQFALDKETGQPCGWSVYTQQESNQLIEEFMLLANMAVAHKISASFPEVAVLRRHEPPQGKQIEELEILCQQLEVQLDTTSSKSIQQSIRNLFYDSSENAQMYGSVVVNLCLRMMQLAKYFCTGTIEDDTKWHHYALCVPLYTHFTSPIRRYADIMVHRLLAASLGIEPLPTSDANTIEKICVHLNHKKTEAKRANDQSVELFFGIFVRDCGPLTEKGTVICVHDKSFDVLITRLGIIKRVYCDQLPLVTFDFERFKKKCKLQLQWKAEDQVPSVRQEINIFTNVVCQLITTELFHWKMTIKHPLQQ